MWRIGDWTLNRLRPWIQVERQTSLVYEIGIYTTQQILTKQDRFLQSIKFKKNALYSSQYFKFLDVWDLKRCKRHSSMEICTQRFISKFTAQALSLLRFILLWRGHHNLFWIILELKSKILANINVNRVLGRFCVFFSTIFKFSLKQNLNITSGWTESTWV